MCGETTTIDFIGNSVCDSIVSVAVPLPVLPMCQCMRRFNFYKQIHLQTVAPELLCASLHVSCGFGVVFVSALFFFPFAYFYSKSVCARSSFNIFFFAHFQPFNHLVIVQLCPNISSIIFLSPHFCSFPSCNHTYTHYFHVVLRNPLAIHWLGVRVCLCINREYIPWCCSPFLFPIVFARLKSLRCCQQQQQ